MCGASCWNCGKRSLFLRAPRSEGTREVSVRCAVRHGAGHGSGSIGQGALPPCLWSPGLRRGDRVRVCAGLRPSRVQGSEQQVRFCRFYHSVPRIGHTETSRQRWVLEHPYYKSKHYFPAEVFARVPAGVFLVLGRCLRFYLIFSFVRPPRTRLRSTGAYFAGIHPRNFKHPFTTRPPSCAISLVSVEIFHIDTNAAGDRLPNVPSDTLSLDPPARYFYLMGTLRRPVVNATEVLLTKANATTQVCIDLSLVCAPSSFIFISFQIFMAMSA